MANSQRLLTQHPDVNLSEPWTWVLDDDLTKEEKPAGRKPKAEVAHSVVAMNEPPPPYKPSEKTNSSSIKCEVCQSVMSLKGREDHQLINCSVCFEDTPLAPAPSGFKYVRCLCNCLIYKSEEDWKTSATMLCDRPNCHRLLKLGQDNTVEATQRYSIGFLKCYQCQTELYKYQNPSIRDTLATCPTCNTVLGTKPTCTKVLIFILTMIGLMAGLGGCALAAEDFKRDTGRSPLLGGLFYSTSMVFLIAAFRVCKAARRFEVPQNLNWYDRSKDDFKLLCEKISFREGSGIQQKQIKDASASVRASEINPREFPSSYKPCANITNSWIKCEACQSWLSLKGREDHRMINCSVCFEDTPLRPAKPGFKYVRCPCNRIATIQDFCKIFLCENPNCHRLVNLGPENSITTTQDHSSTWYRCGQCQSRFFSDSHSSRTIYVRCTECNTMSSIKPMYRHIRAFLFALIALVCWIGGGVILVYSFYIHMGVGPIGIVLYFASVYILTTDSMTRKISHIVSHE